MLAVVFWSGSEGKKGEEEDGERGEGAGVGGGREILKSTLALRKGPFP